MSHRIAAAITGGIIFSLFVVLFSWSAPAQAAQARNEVWRPGTTVCVQAPRTNWHIRAAVQRWRSLPGGPRMVVRQKCGWYNSIRIFVKNSLASWTGYSWSSIYESGYLAHYDIQLNPRAIKAYYPARYGPCLRAYTASHELGHSQGEDHYSYSYPGNVMSYSRWWERCGGLGPHDRAVYYRLY